MRDAQRVSQPPLLLLPSRDHARSVVVGTPDRRWGRVGNDQSREHFVLTANDTCFSQRVGAHYGRDVAGVVWFGVIELVARYRWSQRAG